MQCGKKLPKDARFCSECGTPVTISPADAAYSALIALGTDSDNAFAVIQKHAVQLINPAFWLTHNLASIPFEIFIQARLLLGKHPFTAAVIEKIVKENSDGEGAEKILGLEDEGFMMQINDGLPTALQLIMNVTAATGKTLQPQWLAQSTQDQ